MDEKELSLLGNKTVYKSDYAPEVLEAFTNKHPDNDYWVRFNCPEFTSLCPITGQPDFATIYIDYIPDIKMVESKSLKLSSNPQPIGFSGILLAKRQNSFYCTYFLHNRNVADTKSPYPIKRLEVIRWFNQKSMVFNQSLS